MGTYKYKAKKGPTEVVSSFIDASSRNEAIEKINQLGYMPVYVEEIGKAVSRATAKQAGFSLQFIKPKQITIFTRQLAILLKSGVPILKGLTILAEQSLNNRFRTILIGIRSEVKDGKTLSWALSLYPGIFSGLYISLVQAGEESGTLEESLLRIAEYRNKQEQIFSSIKTALTYPVLMGVVGLGTIIFMLTFVMPRLLKIFTRLGQDLPLPTKVLIAVSNFMGLKIVWVFVGIILLLAIFLVKRRSRTKKEKLLVSFFKLKMPIFGEIFLKAELARFSRTLELLLKSGVQLLKAIQKSIATLNNEIIRDELKAAYKKIEQGESFGTTLSHSKVFPRFMVNLISVGEESGRLEEALKELAFTYDNETDEAVKIMTNLLEPMMILFMGLVVGFIIVSMLLPVFQLNLMIK